MKKLYKKLLNRIYLYGQEKKILKTVRQSQKIKLIVFDIPEHGNIGDHAIAEAQKIFFERHFPEHNYIEIPASLSLIIARKVKNILNSKDIILFHGGGNFGDLYPSHNAIRHELIRRLSDNLFIQLPQSVFFFDNEIGIKSIYDSRKIFSENKENVYFFARERLSLKKMKQLFPDNYSLLVPDIVFSYPKVNFNVKRVGVLTILRDDIEKSTNTQLTNFKEILSNIFDKFDESDTHLGEGTTILPGDRTEYLNRKFKEFCSHEIVVTDRLHGMIFCFITETPCIALDNNNHKVKETFYTWLDDCEYIKFIDNDKLTTENLKEVAVELKNISPKKKNMDDRYESLIHLIQSKLKED